MADEDVVTKGECDRSHAALMRENDLSNKNVTTALTAQSTQLDKLWDALETFRNSFRNHVPPWTAAVMTLEALAIGLLASKAF